MDVLHDLLRGEAAAVESYERLIGRSDESPVTAVLESIRQGHSEAVAVLQERIRHFGGEPEHEWAGWEYDDRAEASHTWPVEAGAPWGGLVEGEEIGIGHYESALSDSDIDTDCKDLIRYRLLPRCRSNVRELGRMRAAAERE